MSENKGTPINIQDSPSKSEKKTLPTNNAIDQIEQIIQRRLDSLHKAIAANKAVQLSDTAPSLDQLKKYLEITKDAMEYAKDRYGPSSIPLYYSIHSQPIKTQDRKEESEYAFYDHSTGTLHTSMLHVAALSQILGKSSVFVLKGHIGKRVSPEDSVFLATVEECHHRDYFSKHPGYKADYKLSREGTDEIELAWAKELPKVIKDRKIETFPEGSFSQIKSKRFN